MMTDVLADPVIASLLVDKLPSCQSMTDSKMTQKEDQSVPVMECQSEYLPPSLSSLLPSHSSADATFVPLIAKRISLPDHLNIVPMLDVLPPSMAQTYSQASSHLLLRSLTEVFALNQTKPLPRPRVAGTRSEYVELIKRLLAQGMIGFTATPKAINGVFAVAKDADTDRLIIDARPMNRLFVDPPHVDIPNPSHLVQLIVPLDQVMYTAKSDLSNYYHHFGLPKWLCDFFALPPLTPEELKLCGLDPSSGAIYPCCLTLAMGWSHSVLIAQLAHQYILYRSGALRPEDHILSLTSPHVTNDRVLHGIVIDDFFLHTLNKSLAESTMMKVFNAYKQAGFVVKQSKVVMPTSEKVKVIGLDIDGVNRTISLPLESQRSLASVTLSALHANRLSGTALSHIIGKWTWIMMLRRPALSICQHVYRYCEIARGRNFTLWKSVKRELATMLRLLPLLHVNLDAPYFKHAAATDASMQAAGVMSLRLTSELERDLWPLCSSRRMASQQTVTQGVSDHESQSHTITPHNPDIYMNLKFEPIYSKIISAPWRTIVSKPWRAEEHINALELRAVLLAIHWILSYTSAPSSRIFLLLDSTVSYFSLWKGRTSSPKLLLIMRKISALLMAGGLMLLPGWVPSEVNPADGPSRAFSKP